MLRTFILVACLLQAFTQAEKVSTKSFSLNFEHNDAPADLNRFHPEFDLNEKAGRNLGVEGKGKNTIVLKLDASEAFGKKKKLKIKFRREPNPFTADALGSLSTEEQDNLPVIQTYVPVDKNLPGALVLELQPGRHKKGKKFLAYRGSIQQGSQFLKFSTPGSDNSDDSQMELEVVESHSEKIIPDEPLELKNGGRLLRNEKRAVKDHGRELVTEFDADCYDCMESERVNTISMGIAITTKMEETWGGTASSVYVNLAVMTSVANKIFEDQMNLRFAISWVFFAKGKGLSWDYPECSNWFNGNLMDTQLYDFYLWSRSNGPPSDTGLMHLLDDCILCSGCNSGRATVGIAYLGTLCSNGNVGISHRNWGEFMVTYAHEIGHNIGSDHSFNEGGIMDYGDGLYDGEYQFWPELQDQICPTLRRKKNNCEDHFNQCVDEFDPAIPHGNSFIVNCADAKSILGCGNEDVLERCPATCGCPNIDSNGCAASSNSSPTQTPNPTPVPSQTPNPTPNPTPVPSQTPNPTPNPFTEPDTCLPNRSTCTQNSDCCSNVCRGTNRLRCRRR